MTTAVKHSPWMMNTKTREIVTYCEAYLAYEDPKFVEYVGPLPPIDFKRGVRIVPEEIIAAAFEPELSEEQRIERLAAVVHLVPKEEISESGVPSTVVLEKLANLKGVRSKEVKAAMKMRGEMLRGKNIIENPPALEYSEAKQGG